jgi:hypothetical protein
MNSITKRFIWVSVYAVAMAYLEATVVVYLRALLGITDITAIDVSLGPYGLIEIGREAATVAMLAVVGWLAGRHWKERWTYGLFAFGFWDVFYYIWLKALIDWPASLLGWDLLFLIPLPWWGPVLAPASIAVLLCVASAMAVVRMARGQRLGVTPLRVGVAAAGSLLAMYTFMSDAIHALLTGPVEWETLRPTSFDWPLFLVALTLMTVPTLAATWPRRDRACAQSRAGYNQRQGERTTSEHRTLHPGAGSSSPSAPTA